MKFFVPGFRRQREMAEYAWLTFRAWLRDEGLPTGRRRILAVVAEIDGADHYIAGNFSIIAHIDHGKSTLADRLIQATVRLRPGPPGLPFDCLGVITRV